MTSFIKVPFASSGDKAAVPDTDAGGGVNMTQGYGQAYSLDPATDPSAKRIERDKMNWLFNRITQAINEIQSGGVAPFITSADNGGSAFSYGKGALVSLGGVVYQSLVANNTSTPPSANWAALPEKIQPLDATLTALAGLVGAANKLPYFNGDDTAALTDLTSVGRDIIGKSSVADILTYLGFTSGTGWLRFPSGHILQIGSAGGFESYTIVLPVPYTNTNYIAVANGTGNTSPPDTGRVFVETANVDNGSFTAICINADGTRSSRGIGWIAFGK